MDKHTKKWLKAETDKARSEFKSQFIELITSGSISIPNPHDEANQKAIKTPIIIKTK